MMSIIGITIMTAQTTGKISGRVYNAETHESLPGANVMVVSTMLGAACDQDGDFYIINVRPGTYTLNISMMGYTTTIISDLVISVNRTASVNIALTPSVILGKEIVVHARNISVEKDKTGTIRNISSKQMALLPVENIDQVVSLQAGIVQGHVRGGRASEVSYLLDGISTTEVFDNSSSTVTVEIDVVEDLEVITGTFNAEYGKAMSGVINAVTKDGNNNFEASGAIGFGNYYTGNNNIFLGMDNSDYDRNKDYKFYLSGPVIPNYLTFVANLRVQNNSNHLNGIRRFEPDNYSDFSSSNPNDWFSQHSGDNKFVSLNFNKSTSYFVKLSSRPTDITRLSLLYSNNKDEWQDYDHSWKYNPDGNDISHSESSLLALQLNVILSRSLFFDVKISNLEYFEGDYIVENPVDSAYYIHNFFLSGSETGFNTGGQEKNHLRRWTDSHALKWDLTWQINKSHMLKTGIEYIDYQLENKWYEITNAYEWLPGDAGSDYMPFIFEDIISTHNDEYKVDPFEFSAYIQDKLEHNEIVINYGLRLDYFDPNTVYPSQRRNPANQLAFHDSTGRMSDYINADVKYQVSPRFGLAYQLSNAAVLHFSYGHFMQMPPLYSLYQNSKFFVAPQDYATTMGDAQLKAQKTVQYEVGIWLELARDLSLEVAVYYRDIYDLLSAKVITTYNQIEYGLFSNKDYSNVKGLDLQLEYSKDQLSTYLNYTLLYVKGNADNETQNFDRLGDARDPITNLIPMSWDQRHTFNATVAYSEAKWGISSTCYYDSGTPFNWEPISTSSLADLNLLPNNEYQPSTFSVDLSAHYRIAMENGMGLTLGLQVYNTFDRLNDSWVDNQTGRAYTSIVTDADLSSHHSDFNDFNDRNHDPSMYSTPRNVKLTLDLNF
jgi:hypothetical protein